MHAVTTRADVCSVRVCETSLSVLELLLDLGVVSTTDIDHSEQEATNYATNGFDQDLSSNSHGICIDIVARQAKLLPPFFFFLSFLFECPRKLLHPPELNNNKMLFRVFQHVGCPHGCGDSRRDPSSDFIRSQGLLLMAQLHRLSGKYFRAFLRQMVTCRYTLAEIVDFLHALVGFCVDPGFVLSPISNQIPNSIKFNVYLNRPITYCCYCFVALFFFIGQKRNSRLGVDSMQGGMGYAPIFNTPRTIEGHVINCIFKCFVTRLTSSLTFLKSSENVVSVFTI